MKTRLNRPRRPEIKVLDEKLAQAIDRGAHKAEKVLERAARRVREAVRKH